MEDAFCGAVVFPIGLSVRRMQRIASPIKAITFAKAILVL